MKKILLSFLFLIGSLGIAHAETYFFTTTVTLTSANTDYTWTMPLRALNVNIQCRTAFDVKMQNQTINGGNGAYFTIKSGTQYNTPAIWSKDNVIYFSSAQAGAIVEIAYWQST